MERLSQLIRRLDKRYTEICNILRDPIYILPLNVTITVHKRVHKGKTYTWSEKRITIPSGWNDETVYVMRGKDYKNLIRLLDLLKDYCRE